MIADIRERTLLSKRIGELREDPDRQGKALSGELRGYRSIRAVERRYRIIYALDGDTVRVLVCHIGTRKAGDEHDVYETARKLIRARLVDLEAHKPPSE